ncbi:hypothetical protein ACROYT_G031060 [Oculina patagonica]
MEVKAAWKILCFLLFFLTVTYSKTRAFNFKAGKDNVTTTTPGLFACKKISFNESFSGGQQVSVLASVGHSAKSPTSRYGAAIWVADVTARGFTVCVLEFGDGSNGTTQVNWIALQSTPRGSQLGSASLSSWTTGTKCEKISFQQVFKTPPTVFVTVSHQSPNRSQDAMAVWVKDVGNNNFKICLRETKIFGGTHKNIKISQRKAGEDVLSILEHEIYKYSKQGKIILLGDLNVRTGTLNDFIENDCHDFLATADTYNLDKNWPKRNNGDYIVNKLGGEILRLCIGNKLRILNGRVTADLDGKLTSYQTNGASTVDYGIVSEDLQDTVLGFQVQALTPYSDHCPNTLKLASRNRDIINNASKNSQRKETSPQNSFTKFLWKSESKDKFISALSRIDIQDKLQSFNTAHHSSIDDEISQFNQILKSVAKRSLVPSRKTRKHTKKHKPWYDNTCRQLKKKLQKLHWMAFSNLRLENVTLTNSVVFNNTSSGSGQNNNVFCQTINFTDPFFAPPVVVVTPKYSYNNNYSYLSQCNAVTAWIEHSSTKDMKVCVRNNNNNNPKSKDIITVDYMTIGDLDPCLDVTCHYHGLCKAFGPHDARCVCVDSCPSYHEPVCSSNGTTYDNECLYKQEMCRLRLNFTVQHPGSCEGFPFQRGRRHMPHIPSLGYSHCQAIRFKPYVFYPDKPIEMQITVNHIDTSDKSYVHDAAVSWVENVNYDQFTACVMAAGYNERKSHANVTVDWMAYQGAPVGGVAGDVRISQWWTGTTCETVNFPSVSITFVFCYI